MKMKYSICCKLLFFLVYFCSCRSNELIPPSSKVNGAAAKIQITPYTIINLAGIASPSSLLDGPGNLAHFQYPYGIQVKPGGIIYVADFGNHAIRKLVVRPLNGNRSQFLATVTTLHTPAGANGLELTFPLRVGVSDDSTMNCQFQASKGPLIFSRIYKPSGTTYTIQSDAFGASGMTMDPSGKFYWLAGNGVLGKFWSDHIELSNYNYYLPGKYTFISLYACPAGTLYLATQSRFFKVNRAGVLSEIKTASTYPPPPYPSITDIVASDDGKTIYFAQNGAIRQIFNMKVTTLIYPAGTASDEGIAANTFARCLAIDDKQHLLYFTDFSSVKILTLPGYTAH